MFSKPTALVALLASATALLTPGSTVVLADQENVPGMPTLARVQVINRGPMEAIPVLVHSSSDPLPVVVMSVPEVTLAPTTLLTRQTRQIWEYRQLRVAAADDPIAGLNAAGAEGWEAVGSVSLGAATLWTLKRPR